MSENQRTNADTNNFGVFRILALGAAVCIATVHFTQPFLNVIAEAFNLTKSAVGWVPTTTLCGYACGIFFLTPLGDIFSIRKLILAKLSVLALTLLIASALQSFPLFLFLTFIIGLCASSVQDFVPIAAHLAPESRRGQMVGFVLTGMLLGSLLSRAVAGFITDLSNWRTTFIVYGLSVAAVAVFGARFIPNLKPTSQAKPLEIYKAMFAWCKNRPQILWLSTRHGLTGFCYSSFWVSLVFVMKEQPFNLSTSQVGYMAVPAVLGALLGSWFGKKADYYGPRSNTFIATLAILVASLSMYFFRENIFQMIVYGILVVLGYQISLVTSQFEILGVDPKARSQLNAILITIQFLFFSMGSYLSVTVYNRFGANGVALLCSVAAAISLLMAFLSPQLIQKKSLKSV